MRKTKEMNVKPQDSQPTKEKVALLNAETELINAQIKNDEAKRLRDLPAALKQKEADLAEKDSRLADKEKGLKLREETIVQNERLMADAYKRLSAQKTQIEEEIRAKAKELVEAVKNEANQRDEVEIALAYITDVSPILINPFVKEEIVKRLEKCLGRWGIMPQYDGGGRYVRSVYRVR